MMTDRELEIALAIQKGERVTATYMQGRIAKVCYQQLEGTTTICQIVLDNGYSVLGESACVDPENFDRTIGQKIAYDNAFQKLWPLFGFLLAESRFRRDEDKRRAVQGGPPNRPTSTSMPSMTSALKPGD